MAKAWHWLCGCGRLIRKHGLGRHGCACMFARIAKRMQGEAER
jgi:hypothetical protein